ncbi:MAG TPA: GNAT family N-acetyltransferase [Ktedonobacteraceae bacterium]|jgi:RimJ/RimL family protein N-acetyltransferase
MQPVQSLHDRNEIAHFLSQKSEQRAYELGDLDDFFWPYTTWYGLKKQQEIQQLLLLYTGVTLPTLLCTGRNQGAVLLEASRHFLPKRFYAHILPEYAECLQPDYHMESHGLHYKYALHHRERVLVAKSRERTRRLKKEDLETLLAFYEESYPGNWFDARMLETGQYYGIWREERLASIAGIHVYSPAYKIATLGNVTTHPAYRGQGLSTMACTTLCQELLKTVEHIGLNVKADNVAAITVYERLGFEPIEVYEEFFCELAH